MGFFRSLFGPSRNEIWTALSAQTDVLVVDVADRIRDVERLEGLYDVFAETLHELSRMGVAGEGTGGVSL